MNSSSAAADAPLASRHCSSAFNRLTAAIREDFPAPLESFGP
ncbi:hypothetical protein [Lentzea sp. NPDC092896]